ncbi:hypothetical protein GOARA_063_01710 [Gordonia araii NBRC 100433]|uniref:HEAT repeat-containing protein n=1 Tax=Gordonia araii NBRC 100433 TaxID=1073574 RepID=G7H547_9ACTN|nr:HEAT repeat domain-containing protein [Gordonia araii]NNG96662.1 HEAT repeat domain-containing protein [Gordonia araii NBRC 100433]GAB10972.1 hypothetical protein GOARA_063_01710 [Gordonia araii NBRC 100433]
MTTTTPIIAALAGRDSSTRLRAALEAGRSADERLTETLVTRCAVEPDFFVRDMLTWALCRLPPAMVVPRLIAELSSPVPQARAQALHTLSKIGDASSWPAVSELLADGDDEVARSAWRAAVATVPAGEEERLADAFATQLGRGDLDMHRSLSRALAELGESAIPALRAAAANGDPRVRDHAEATERLRLDPDSGFTPSVELARRIAAAGADLESAPGPEEDEC